MSLAQSQIGSRIVVIAASDAKVISAGQQSLKFFEVIDDRVGTGPNKVRLLLCPIRMALERYAIIGMVKRSAVFPVGPEDLRESAVGLALRPLAELEECLCGG